MPVVERQGRSIHHSRDGDGPGILLIPGLGSGARLFGTLPRRFMRSGFTCAAIDPVGLEPSSPLPGGIFDFTQAAHDVLAVAATLPQPVTLVGTSLDGKHLGELTAPFLFGETFLNQKAGVVDDIIRSTKPSAETRAFMQTQARALQTFDGQALCPKVDVPTLCLAGAEDTLTLPHEVTATAALIPNAQHHCFEGAGHSLLLESAQAFDHVTKFAK